MFVFMCVIIIISLYIELNLTQILWFLISEYTIHAKVIKGKRGHPKISFDGYTYGQSKMGLDKGEIVWSCTGSAAVTRKRCLARVQTKVIDGYMMMCVRNQNHICLQTQREK